MTELKKLIVSLNGAVINYRDGVTINFTFNEDLDSGVLIIPALASKLNIKRNDVITLFYNTGNNTTETKYFLVGGFSWDYETQNYVQSYTYTISLVSITMKLQNDLLPNVTITQPLGSTKRTIYWEIDRLNKILGNKYTLHSTLQQKTNNTICPEFQWNKRNFWEILNDLLAVVDCVVTMTDSNTISCISYSDPGSEIPSDKIINVSYHEDPNEYCTELEMNAENIVGDNVSTMSQSWITPRSIEYILTTDNAQVILDKPIYYIDKVYVKVKLAKNVTIKYKVDGESIHNYIEYKTTYAANTEFIFDITQFVVEEEVYATKQVFSYIVDPVDEFSEDVFEMKKYFLKYKMGSNIIDALSYYDTKYWNINGQRAIYNIIDFSLLEYWYTHDVAEMEQGHIYTPYEIVKDSDAYPDLRTLLFKVDYTSLNTIRFRTQKENSSGLNHKVLASNQNASYVDAKAIGLSEQANANRIGNPYYEISLRDYIPGVNDYYEDNGDKYYLSQYSLQINNIGDYYCKGQFVKDFIRKNLFTGINSKARFTSIAKDSEALLRQDIHKCKFAISNSSGTSHSLANYIWNYLGKSKELVSLVKTDAVSNYYFLPTSNYLIGNKKIIIEFRFQDNVSAGMHIESTSTNAYVCQGSKYVDNNGEFEDLIFALMPPNDSDTDYVTRGEKYPIAYSNGSKINSIPLGVSQFVILNALKDNREIYGICFNLEFVETQNIKIYDKFYELLPMVNENETDIHIFIATEQYDIYASDITNLANGDNRYITNHGNYIEFDIISYCHDNNVDVSNVTSWGFCTSNNEKILESFDIASSNRKLYINKLS